MSTIHFYEKPGCISNGRQKQLLLAAGHTLLVHDILTAPWRPERLRAFFGELPVAEWFNRNAPQIKSGELDPAALDIDEALARMVANPLLIRRPLMQVGEQRHCGFDAEQVSRWIGLDPSAGGQASESCPFGDTAERRAYAR